MRFVQDEKNQLASILEAPNPENGDFYHAP